MRGEEPRITFNSLYEIPFFRRLDIASALHFHTFNSLYEIPNMGVEAPSSEGKTYPFNSLYEILFQLEYITTWLCWTFNSLYEILFWKAELNTGFFRPFNSLYEIPNLLKSRSLPILFSLSILFMRFYGHAWTIAEADGELSILFMRF